MFQPTGYIMIINELKKILLDVNVSLTELAEALGKRLNKPYSLNNLSNKLRNETISHREMVIIADILGYDLKFVRRAEKK
jgi:hypothetical protein